MPNPCGEIPLEALEAARAAALLGESFSLQVLADAGVAANQLDSLFDEGVLVQDSDIHASFANVACRKQLLKEIPWSFRRSWSLKLGERLELLKGNPEDIGRLFIAAQLFDRAKPHLIKGAEKACLCNDYLKALSLLRQVFDIWKENEDPTARMKLLREMARCAANTTDYDTAVIAWEEILENARTEDNLEVQIEAHQQLAQWTGIMGRRQSVREHLQLAAELAGKLDDPASEARQWFEFAGFQVTHVRLASAN
ncbi:MAG: hypothetical protein KJT03_14945 [Verrucomicrobiae bacterium]|nr:hypothetical protein [Verrucomicrobiae bacterium]